MTTPTQQLQEETIQELKDHIEEGTYTVLQALRRSYLLGRQAELQTIKKEVDEVQAFLNG